MKFLLDANMSPKTADFLRGQNYDVKSLIEEELGQITDSEVVKLAQREHRVIITHDLDFGEIYYFKEKNGVGVIVLRLRNQTIESTNKAIQRFWENKKFTDEEVKKSLIIVSETTYRVYRG